MLIEANMELVISLHNNASCFIYLFIVLVILVCLVMYCVLSCLFISQV